jgi:hypothetical protein
MELAVELVGKHWEEARSRTTQRHRHREGLEKMAHFLVQTGFLLQGAWHKRNKKIAKCLEVVELFLYKKRMQKKLIMEFEGLIK